MANSSSVTKDLYKILQVSRTATTLEIKAAYRKLALALHPDRHDGCQVKTKAFKEASEAYTILMDNVRRRDYDMASGYTPSGWYNKNRRRPVPSNYRKVYAPHAPPDGKWHDAQRHYDMHYGDGMFQEAIKDAYNRAKQRGDFDYQSPLGKGFTFESVEERRKNNNYNNASSRYSQNSYFNNPYSKAVQGPPEVQYQYEESYINKAKTVLKRKQTVVNKLHERRQERIEREESSSSSLKAEPIFPGQRMYHPLNQQPPPPSETTSFCTIM